MNRPESNYKSPETPDYRVDTSDDHLAADVQEQLARVRQLAETVDSPDLKNQINIAIQALLLTESEQAQTNIGALETTLRIEGLYENLAPKKSENLQLADDLDAFIKNSIQNTHEAHLSEFNINDFETQGLTGLDAFEFPAFEAAITQAVNQIIALGSYDKFLDTHQDAAYKGIFSPDKMLADASNEVFGGFILGDNDRDNTFAEDTAIFFGLSPEEQANMRATPFDWKSLEKWGMVGQICAIEMGSGAENTLRMFTNLPAAIILLPRYLTYRIQINQCTEPEKTEAIILQKELVDNNPALKIVELMGEQGIEVIKNLASLLKFGTVGDVAIAASLLPLAMAGGVGISNLLKRLSKPIITNPNASTVLAGTVSAKRLTGHAVNADELRSSDADNPSEEIYIAHET